jgi:hypothetical protein
MFFDDFPAINKAKSLALADFIRSYIGSDACAGEPLEGLLKLIIIAATSVAVGAHQEILSGEPDGGGLRSWRPAFIAATSWLTA